MRIAHLSDIHVRCPGPFFGTRFSDLLFNKRITGLLNMMTKRSGAYSEKVLQTALQDMEEQGVDHVIITGDLTNLSLPCEFAEAKRILFSSLSPSTTSIVPGNHDVYTDDAESNDYFGETFGDVPFARRPIPGLEVIGVSSAIPQRAFKADGVITPECIKGAEDSLRELHSTEADGSTSENPLRILALHHPPVSDKHGLDSPDRERLGDYCRTHHVDLVLHGHTHQPDVELRIDNAKDVLCFEAGSLTWTGKALPPRYHIYDWTPGSSELHARARIWRGDGKSGVFEDIKLPSHTLPHHTSS